MEDVYEIDDSNIDNLIDVVIDRLNDLGADVDPEDGAVMFEKSKAGRYRLSIQAELVEMLTRG